jgi:threonine synthase
VVRLECPRCRTLFEDARPFTGCPRCREDNVPVNLTVKLDLGPLTRLRTERFPATPLIHLERLGRRLGLGHLYAKDESQNPTWSYKDRLCSVAVTHAVETGARVDEVAEDLGWRAPDLVVVPSAYSDGLFGVYKGMAEPAALERALEVPEPVRGEGSVAFSIASRYGTYQGLRALEAQRALAREEGVFVEPSSAAALTAVMQLVARKAVDPEQTIVLVLTSSGLKDPGASRAWLPEVPASGDDFDALLGVLRESYGLDLHR